MRSIHWYVVSYIIVLLITMPFCARIYIIKICVCIVQTIPIEHESHLLKKAPRSTLGLNFLSSFFAPYLKVVGEQNIEDALVKDRAVSALCHAFDTSYLRVAPRLAVKAATGGCSLLSLSD